MYECPNCAGNLKFDIASQKMLCPNCSTSMDPYEIRKDKDAQESNDFETTIFTCPQCGGEIISEDNTAATFCSFCGGTVTLDSRISRERRPGFIIPFQKDMQDCKKAFESFMSRAIFAPRVIKDKRNIEKFRGIYMPYWLYSFGKKENIGFSGSRSSQSGDYLYTKYYNLNCNLDASYRGVAYDASASFGDNLSSAIAPFDLHMSKKFTPAFLSGFYADTSDVESEVYLSDAQDMVTRDISSRIRKHAVCRKYGAGTGKNEKSLENAVRPQLTATDLAMFPVWFLACRSKGGVNYIVVNGQTGKAVGDVPVDPKKYLFGSLLLAIPLFFLLNMLFTIKPIPLLVLSVISTILCLVISLGQLGRLQDMESGKNDAGLQFLQTGGTKKPVRKRMTKEQKKAEAREWSGLLIKTLVSSIIGILVLIFHPVSDLAYYGAALLGLVASFWTLIDIIGRYNRLTTRPLPQFRRKGVDKNA